MLPFRRVFPRKIPDRLPGGPTNVQGPHPARRVVRATERYIHLQACTANTEEEEEREIECRKNVPIFLLKKFFLVEPQGHAIRGEAGRRQGRAPRGNTIIFGAKAFFCRWTFSRKLQTARLASGKVSQKSIGISTPIKRPQMSALDRPGTERPRIMPARTHACKLGDAADDAAPLSTHGAASEAAQSHCTDQQSTTVGMSDVHQEYE